MSAWFDLTLNLCRSQTRGARWVRHFGVAMGLDPTPSLVASAPQTQARCGPSECLPSVCPVSFAQGGLTKDFSVEPCFSNLLTRVRRTTRFPLFMFFC